MDEYAFSQAIMPHGFLSHSFMWFGRVQFGNQPMVSKVHSILEGLDSIG